METSLKELEEIYANKPGWKVIEEGGLLSIPVEEFRMINLPKPDRDGKIKFGENKEKGAGNQIESYPITQTIPDLNEQIMVKYNKEKATAEAAAHCAPCNTFGEQREIYEWIGLFFKPP